MKIKYPFYLDTDDLLFIFSCVNDIQSGKILSKDRLDRSLDLLQEIEFHLNSVECVIQDKLLSYLDN